jgi:hypothetical protein
MTKLAGDGLRLQMKSLSLANRSLCHSYKHYQLAGMVSDLQLRLSVRPSSQYYRAFFLCTASQRQWRLTAGTGCPSTIALVTFHIATTARWGPYFPCAVVQETAQSIITDPMFGRQCCTRGYRGDDAHAKQRNGFTDSCFKSKCASICLNFPCWQACVEIRSPAVPPCQTAFPGILP